MNVLLLGGAGLIGSAILSELARSSPLDNVMVVDNLMYARDYLYGDKFKNVDIGDSKEFAKVVDTFKPDVILHFAGIVGDEACRLHPRKAKSINVDSVEWLANNFEGRIVFPSSCSIFGSSDELLTEESPFNPLSLYAEQKIEAEQLLSKHNNTLILRLGTIHGLSRRFRNDLVVNTLTLRAIKYGKINVYGGEQYRPLIHVSDVARTVVSNMNTGVGTYNISFKNYRISEIGNIIASKTNSVVTYGDIQQEDRRNYRVDNSKALKNLVFTPFYDIEYTIETIKTLYESGAIKDVSNINYSNVGKVEFVI